MARTKKVVEENVDELNDSKTEIYEIGYIMVPTIAEENLGAEVSSLKDKLLEKKVVFISDEYPKMMELAYEMSRSILNKKQKFSYGYFGWIKFETETKNALNIKNYLDNNENIVRYLLIKTIKGNTMSVKKPYGRDNGKRRSVKKEEVEVINEEVIDKEIDALVI